MVVEESMTNPLRRGLPKEVPWTLGGSVRAVVLNCLRVPRSVERRLARRFIEDITDAGDGLLAVRLKAREDKLYFPDNLPQAALFQTLVEQLYSWHWHYYQIPQTQVEADDVVFDCGCAEGVFAFLARRRVARIYAFEPLPAFLKGLRRTFADSRNVEIVPCALAESPGSAYLHEAGISSSITSEPTATPVAIESIDHYCVQNNVRMSFLKADLEGYEMNVLRGAAEAIRANKPRVAITTYHRKDHALEIARWLKSLNPGYRMMIKGICRLNGSPIMLHAW
jgi:FkbM family methyltransferase